METTEERERVTFFEVLGSEKTDHHLRLSCRVPLDLNYFEGHFEGTPVVAGVVQLEWIDKTIQRYFDHRLDFTGMEAVKFHQLLFPNSHFTLEIQHHPEKRKWSYIIMTDTGKVASGRFLESAHEVSA